MDALKVDGPSTASMLAARTGQAVGNASHHLKVLAEAGLVEEAPELAKDRRERWWRLVSSGTRWSRAEFGDDASAVAAALPGDRIRVHGKGGRAYGFTIECSYVTNETTGRSVFVAAVVYANDNDVLNDDRYPYGDVADPFVARLGRVVARAFLAEETR